MPWRSVAGERLRPSAAGAAGSGRTGVVACRLGGVALRGIVVVVGGPGGAESHGSRIPLLEPLRIKDHNQNPSNP